MVDAEELFVGYWRSEILLLDVKGHVAGSVIVI